MDYKRNPDELLQQYLATVPRKGCDIILHFSAKDRDHLCEHLNSIVGEITNGHNPSQITGAPGLSGWVKYQETEWVDA